MTKEKLTKYWNENFPTSLPIASELKNTFDNQWFRIHTLPESKRYPENESEYAEILKRHNLILTDLFNGNISLIIISMGYGFNKESIVRNENLKNLGFQKNFWMSIDVSEKTDEESYYWNIFYDELKFTENSLNDLLRLIADDEVREIMFILIDNNIVYHPYDGGADIIFENSILRDKYKEKYQDWLSKHPKGL